MHEIKLSVNEENLQTVLTILNNLKSSLIVDMKIDGKEAKVKKSTQYQPKTNTIIREENSGTHDTSGKYINAAAYKDRLKRKK